MDGIEAIIIVRGMPSENTVPTIAVTVSAMPQDVQMCLDASMNEVLSKLHIGE